MSMATLSKEVCTVCKQICWVNLGNIDDMTVCEPDGAVCPHCGHSFLFEGVQEIMEVMGDNLGSALLIQAYKTANEAAQS